MTAPAAPTVTARTSAAVGDAVGFEAVGITGITGITVAIDRTQPTRNFRYRDPAPT